MGQHCAPARVPRRLAPLLRFLATRPPRGPGRCTQPVCFPNFLYGSNMSGFDNVEQLEHAARFQLAIYIWGVNAGTTAIKAAGCVAHSLRPGRRGSWVRRLHGVGV